MSSLLDFLLFNAVMDNIEEQEQSSSDDSDEPEDYEDNSSLRTEGAASAKMGTCSQSLPSRV